GRGALVVGQWQLGDRGVGALHRGAYARQPGRGEGLQPGLAGDDHADPAAAAVEQVGAGAVADDVVVHEQGVRALDGLRAEGDDGPRPGAFEHLDAARAEAGAGDQDGDGPQFRPGGGGLVVVQADGA